MKSNSVTTVSQTVMVRLKPHCATSSLNNKKQGYNQAHL